ncbi:hypothetical protein PV327_011109 [Microctonus hyperodae]|uniref:F-box domain-containing protein n=1 Tax=Microctonus hyperodae TaxID=165561 RepID=A0AA39FRF8_MICHY|nr:hypothetical protein PV327_011109 [Microctonus hyperodae]
MAEIEILNDDVLREIFSYLNLRDRVRMGLVCKKWQNVHKSMMRSIHKMYCDVYHHICEPVVKPSVDILNNVLVLSICTRPYLAKRLKKFASNLHTIVIHDTECDCYMLYKFYRLLPKCTKLKSAQLNCNIPMTATAFLQFLPTDNLENLSINMSFRPYPIVISELSELMRKVLAKSRKLKSLNVRKMPISKGSWAELIRKCRKLHTIRIDSEFSLPENILKEMMSLQNLRNLFLYAYSGSYETWHQFSNLENICILQFNQPYSLPTKNQIKSFLQRSRNLKTYYFFSNKLTEMVQQVASDIGHECKKNDFEYLDEWIHIIPPLPQNTYFFSKLD